MANMPGAGAITPHHPRRHTLPHAGWFWWSPASTAWPATTSASRSCPPTGARRCLPALLALQRALPLAAPRLACADRW